MLTITRQGERTAIGWILMIALLLAAQPVRGAISTGVTVSAADRHNLSNVEVLAASDSGTSTIAGGITPAALANGATVTLSQVGTTVSTATVDAGGKYSFSGVGDGTYIVTPTKAGIIFSPAFQAVTVSGSNATVAAFTATSSGAAFMVAGSITPASLGSGATVTLGQSGTTVSTATADAGGRYSFSGIVDGTYTVTPARAGIAFSPVFQTVTVSGGNATVAAFTATAAGTAFTVSGSITPASLGSGATVTLSQSGTPVSTATVDVNGAYSLTGLANGTYTVTPTKAGVIFTPVSQSVTVSGANATVAAFTATSSFGNIATDVTVSTNRSTFLSNITTPTFSTAAADELLLAFVAADARTPGVTVTSMTGAGLTWTLVQRTNAQMGTAEIWRAFAPARLNKATVRADLSQSVPATLTVISFTGVDTSGINGAGAIGAIGSGSANPGAPTASLVTTRDNSWVFGVGSDWDNALARTVPANQTMVNQYLASVGNTYWIQRLSVPTPARGTTVTINDTAPATDRYNLTIVELLPAPASGSSLFGTITPGSLGSGATVTLSQGGTVVSASSADAGGNYSFPGLAGGSYTVTPAKPGITFSPASQNVTVSGTNATVPAFTATASGATFTVAGSITPGSVGGGATVTLSQGGATVATATADGSGNYSLTGMVNGTYTATPTKAGVAFRPISQSVTVKGANATVAAFAAVTPDTAYTVSGSITPSALANGTTVTLRQGGTTVSTATVDVNGNYSLTGVVNGTYTAIPTKAGIDFSPASQSVTVNGANATIAAFAATAEVSGAINPASSAAGTLVVLSGANLTFSKTVDNSGKYRFTGLPPGSYTLTPSKTGYGFIPVSQSVTIRSGSVTSNFTVSGSAANLTVDGALMFQTMDGMGVNINVNSWKEGQLKPALDFLVATNGSTLYRVVRDPMDWVASEALIPALHSLNPATLQQVYETPKMRDIWNTIGYLNQLGIRGGQILLNFMGWTPTWLGGSGSYGAKSHITPGKESAFATMVASLVYYGKEVKKLDFTYVSPSNEQDWDCLEGPCIDATQYRTVLRELADELKSMQVDGVRFIGPDTAVIGVSPSYISEMMMDNQVAGLTDHFALHDYSDKPVSPGTAYSGKNYWLTETSAVCSTCDEGGAGPPDEWIFAGHTFDLALADVKNGFAGVLLWDGYDSFWYHHNGFDLSGDLAYDPGTGLYTPRKRAYAYAQFNRFIASGDRVIGASESLAGVPTILAVYNPDTGKVAIMGRNSGNAAITINGQLANLPVVSTLALYETTTSANLARRGDISVSGGFFSAQISADAIFTLTNQPITP